MKPTRSDLGLKTLLTVRNELGIDLDTDLLHKCFEIQKNYQFNSERALSTKAMDRLVEAHVEKMAKRLKKDGAC